MMVMELQLNTDANSNIDIATGTSANTAANADIGAAGDGQDNHDG